MLNLRLLVSIAAPLMVSASMDRIIAKCELSLNFFAGNIREPYQQEIETMMCQTDAFFSDTLQNLVDDSLEMNAMDVTWSFDGESNSYPLVVTFNAAISSSVEISETNSDLAAILEVQDMSLLLSNYISKVSSDNVFLEVSNAMISSDVSSVHSPLTSSVSFSTTESLCQSSMEATSDLGSITNGALIEGGIPVCTWSFDFSSPQGEEPTQQHIESIICLTDAFFSSAVVESALYSEGLSLDIEMLSSTYDGVDSGEPLEISFSVKVTSSEDPSGTNFDPKDILDVMEAEDPNSFLKDYVWTSGSLVDTFFQSALVTFSGTVGDANTVESTTFSSGLCPPMVPSCTLSFGFFKEVPDVMQQEVQSLMCQTDLFFSRSLAGPSGDTPLEMNLIESKYDNTKTDYPFEVTFTTFQDASNPETNHLTPQEILNKMKLSDLYSYLTEHVMQLTGDVFSEIMAVKLDGKVVDMPADDSTTFSTNECLPIEDNIVDILDDRMREFNLAFSLQNGQEAMSTDIYGMICQINLFFTPILANALDDTSLQMDAEIYDWGYSDDTTETSLLVTFKVSVSSSNDPDKTWDEAKIEEAIMNSNLDEFLQSYVRKSHPQSRNVFRSTEKVLLKSTLLTQEKYEIAQSASSKTISSALCQGGYYGEDTDVPVFSLLFSFTSEVQIEPKQEEIEDMMCKTSQYFTSLFNDASLKMEAIDIHWTYDETMDFPLEVHFTPSIDYSQDSNAVPSLSVDQILSTMDGINYHQYVYNYLWQTTLKQDHSFYHVEGIFHEEGLAPASENPSSLTTYTCPSLENQLVQGYDVALHLKMNFGFFTMSGTGPSQEELEGMMCKTKEYFFKTLSLQVDSTDSKWGFDPEADLPLTVYFTVSVNSSSNPQDILSKFMSGNHDYIADYLWKLYPVGANTFYEVNRVVISEAESDSVENLSQLSSDASCTLPGAQPTVDKLVCRMELGFFTGEEAKLLNDDIQAMMCQTDAFFTLHLAGFFNEPSLQMDAMNIESNFDNVGSLLPVVIQFVPLVQVGGQDSQEPPEKILAAMKQANFQDFILNYIHLTEPQGRSPFYYVNEVSFNGEINAVIENPEGITSISSNQCKISDSDEARSSIFADDQALTMMFFTFSEDRKEEPTQEELGAMMCEVDNFYTQHLQATLDTPSLNFNAQNIRWKYTEDKRVFVAFEPIAFLADGSIVSHEDLTLAMQDVDLDDLISKYVWNSYPIGDNTFYYANGVSFEAEVWSRVKILDEFDSLSSNPVISTALCPFSRSTEDSNSDISLSSDVPRISLAFQFFPGKAKREPSTAEVQAMLCRVDQFFSQVFRDAFREMTLSVSEGTSDVEFDAVNIKWLSDVSDEQLTFQVEFDVLLYGTGQTATLISNQDASNLLQFLRKSDFKQLIYSVHASEPQGDNIFFETMGIMPSGSVRSLLSDPTFEANEASTSSCVASMSLDKEQTETVSIISNFSLESGNMDGVTIEEVNEGYDVFVKALFSKEESTASRFLFQNRRHLSMNIVQGSAKIDTLNEVECAPDVAGSSSSATKCYTASAEYEVLAGFSENVESVGRKYAMITISAMEMGSMEQALKSVDPEASFHVVPVNTDYSLPTVTVDQHVAEVPFVIIDQVGEDPKSSQVVTGADLIKELEKPTLSQNDVADPSLPIQRTNSSRSGWRIFTWFFFLVTLLVIAMIALYLGPGRKLLRRRQIDFESSTLIQQEADREACLPFRNVKEEEVFRSKFSTSYSPTTSEECEIA